MCLRPYSLPLMFGVVFAMAMPWGEARSQESPNIVLIVADDLGWSDLGKDASLASDHPYNQHLSEYHETPNINALARSGVTFTQAYATPLCSPTRAALMSGLSAARTNFFTVNDEANANNTSDLVAPDNETEMSPADYSLLPTFLSANNYVTGAVGKWHLGTPDIGNGPIDHGFQFAAGGNRTGAIYDHFADSNGNYKARENENGYITDLNASPGEYLADAIHNTGLSFIEANKDSPFFLYEPHYSVHNPVQAPDEYVQQFDGKPSASGDFDPTFAGMLKNLDDHVGEIVSYLETTDDPRRPGHKLIENTYIMFYGDNGSDLRWSSNAPLRGNKGTLYEGGYRVPLIIKGPETQAGTTTDALVQAEDMFATLIDIAGGQTPEVTDGISFAGELDADAMTSATRDYAYWHHPTLRRSEVPRSVVRDTQGWKLIYDYLDEDPTDGGKFTLYNLNDDLSETTNLAMSVGGVWQGQTPEANAAMQRLMHKLRGWLVATDATLPTFRSNGEYVPLPPEAQAIAALPTPDAPFYSNDFSAGLNGVVGLTSGFDTQNSTWTLDSQTGVYQVSITGNLNNGAATLQLDADDFGGPVESAKSFQLTGTFEMTPYSTSGSLPDQFSVWFLGDDIATSLNDKFRFLVQADGTVFLEEVVNGSFVTLASSSIGSLDNGESNAMEITISGYYVDTDDDNVNDSLNLVATVDAGEHGTTTVSVTAGANGGTTHIYTGQEVAVQFRSRSSGNVMLGSIDSLAVSHFLPLAISGDYNGDGIVDMADYTVWRNSLGGDAEVLAAGSRDPFNYGEVNAEDFLFWKENFGNQASPEQVSQQQVPEPTGVALLMVGTSSALLARTRQAETSSGQSSQVGNAE